MTRRERPRSAATIQQVADLAGVSVSTAARALGSYGSVSPAVRERVAAAAKTLGYRRNSIARSMITGTTHTIGLVVADIENPFFARAARGVADVAHRAGYEVLLVNSDENPSTERAAVRTLSEKQVDGLIIAPASSDSAHHLAELVAHGTPVVLIDRVIAGVEADAVVVDNEFAARRAVEHLTALGHTRIALLTSQGLVHTNQARLAGYLDGLQASGVPVAQELIRMALYTREAAVHETQAVLGLAEPPTAIFTTDNLMSLGAVEGIQRSGRRVPEEISIVGFDDLEWTTIVRPPLTVVVQPVYELGAAAATRLFERIGGSEAPPDVLTLATTFVIRGSTGPIPATMPGRA
ncbi:MAG: LacI family DNA-binding transcriptional regulator [Candidatus Limnocylindrales bacterium]